MDLNESLNFRGFQREVIGKMNSKEVWSNIQLLMPRHQKQALASIHNIPSYETRTLGWIGKTFTN